MSKKSGNSDILQDIFLKSFNLNYRPMKINYQTQIFPLTILMGKNYGNNPSSTQKLVKRKPSLLMTIVYISS